MYYSNMIYFILKKYKKIDFIHGNNCHSIMQKKLKNFDGPKIYI